MRGLLQCQFWDGWGLSTPPSWDKKLWSTQNQAEISRPKIKFGDLPRWVRSCLKQEPRQSWKFPLCSCEPNDLVPCEQTRSWRVLEPWEMRSGEVEMSNRRVISRHLFSWKNRGLLAQFDQENNGFGRSFTWPFQIRCLQSKDDAWIGRLADRGLHRLEQTSRAFSHWECLILGPWLVVDFPDGGKSTLKTWALDGGFDLQTGLKKYVWLVDSTNNAIPAYLLNKTAPIPPLVRWSGSQEMLINGTSDWIYDHSMSSITP